MNDLKKKLIQLLEKNELSLTERSWLLSYIETPLGDKELQQIMQEKFAQDTMDQLGAGDIFSDKILRLIHEKIDDSAVEKPNALWFWTTRIAIAASLAGILSFAAFLYHQTSQNSPPQKVASVTVFKNDVRAGAKKAVLLLANGSTIELNDAKSGNLPRQGNATILKFNGKLSYIDNKSTNAKVVYNTLATPRASRYQLELPDGTMVWLNAASSIRFPTRFAGRERRVAITGEAYFEVAKNKQMPFIVNVDRSEIKVLGTHFNVMAYKDEQAVKTTLIEGSVQFINGISSYQLSPGEQSVLSSDGKVTTAKNVDVSEVVAWKNGYFHFENASIETVMHQLSRWYDVDVVYKTKIDDSFYAEIPSSSNLSDVLKVLAYTGKVNFSIDGKKIIVEP